MDSGPSTNEQFKKRRGRPPGTNSGKTGQSKSGPKQKIGSSIAQAGIQDTSLVQLEQSSLDARQDSSVATNPFSDFLQNIFRQDHIEIERVARELDVAENTVYRWMNGISVPRASYLKKLPDIFPEHRALLIGLIKQVFGDVVGNLTPAPHEVRKEIYIKVLELAASSQDEEARMWQVSQTIFEYALLHMDAEHLGLVITYARVMQPHDDTSVHSLYEVNRRSNDPNLISIEATAFLGSTSLAGAAAVTQRLQIWHDTDSERTLFEREEFERSSCAVPVLRNSQIAGVLTFSSTQPDFFKPPLACQAATEFALLMAVAISDKEFHSPSILNLRPMPDLQWQRQRIADTYLDRVIMYARKHAIARRDAELQVQREMEVEFEAEARRMLEERQKDVEDVHAVAKQSPNTSLLR